MKLKIGYFVLIGMLFLDFSCNLLMKNPVPKFQITLSPDYAEWIQDLSFAPSNSPFSLALETIKNNHTNPPIDPFDAFLNQYKKTSNAISLSSFFVDNDQLNGLINETHSNEETIKLLKTFREEEALLTCQKLRERFKKSEKDFLMIRWDEADQKIKISLPFEPEKEELSPLFKRAKLEISPLFTRMEIMPKIQEAIQQMNIGNKEEMLELFKEDQNRIASVICIATIDQHKKINTFLSNRSTQQFLPVPSNFYWKKSKSPISEELIYELYFTRENSNGSFYPHVIDSEIIRDQFQNEQLIITFDEAGAKRFGTMTSRNLDKQLGLLINKQLLSAPTVIQAIHEGKVAISGGDLQQDLNTFHHLLSLGQLPFSFMDIKEEKIKLN